MTRRLAIPAPPARLALTLLVLALALAPGLGRGASAGGDPLEAPLRPHELTRVDAGETVARLADPPRGAGGSQVPVGIVAAIVEAPPERVFRAIVDFGTYHQFMPYMVSSQREERRSPRSAPAGSNGASGPTTGPPIWRMRFDLPFPAPEAVYRVTTEHAVHLTPETPAGTVWTASWRSLPGRGFTRGSWTLTESSPGHTLVVFRTQSDAGGVLPRFLQDRLTLRSLPWVLDSLRLHVRRCRFATPRPDGCTD